MQMTPNLFSPVLYLFLAGRPLDSSARMSSRHVKYDVTEREPSTFAPLHLLPSKCITMHLVSQFKNLGFVLDKMRISKNSQKYLKSVQNSY